MSNRLPASLAYILIYNPILPPPAYTSRDDEDAQEEAHILFYTSRERAVSRDRMLRQVGLAKALVNFSDIFALGQGCDNVHSQSKRMVHVSPEPNFWMHACVDLARTRKPSNGVKETKGKDPPPQAYHHHEDSVHDLALRSHLLRGYEAFKLLHGTFTSMLEIRGSEYLRAQLEHFFTPWAWKWDPDKPIGFSTHLGLPLHPLNSTLAPIVTSFFNNVPSNATPLLLSPPYIICPPKSTPQYPPSLPAYLLSLVPPPNRSVRHRTPSKKQSPSNNVRAMVAGSTNNSLGFLGSAGAGMGDAMNVMKWSWPGALTFGKQKPPPSKLDGLRSAEPGDVANVADPVKMSIKPPYPNASTTRVEVDQFALDDAIIDRSRVSPPDELVRTADGNDQKKEFGALQSSAGSEPFPSMEYQKLDCSRANSPSDTALSPSPPPNRRSFSVFKAFISEPSDTLVVQRQSVIYLSMFELVFAVLMEPGWLEDDDDESLKTVQHNAPEFLQDVRGLIDGRNTRDSSAMAEKKMTPSHTRHIISSHSTVSTSEGFLATSSQFFNSQEMLARDTSVTEVFSRTATPQHWFVAKRGLGFNKVGDKVEGEAYLEASNKDASLVDADNELAGAVRRWVH